MQEFYRVLKYPKIFDYSDIFSFNFVNRQYCFVGTLCINMFPTLISFDFLIAHINIKTLKVSHIKTEQISESCANNQEINQNWNNCCVNLSNLSHQSHYVNMKQSHKTTGVRRTYLKKIQIMRVVHMNVKESVGIPLFDYKIM